MLVAREDGKTWSEAAGDVQKAQEITEFAWGNTYILNAAMPTPMTSLRITIRYKEAEIPDGVLNV